MFKMSNENLCQLSSDFAYYLLRMEKNIIQNALNHFEEKRVNVPGLEAKALILVFGGILVTQDL